MNEFHWTISLLQLLEYLVPLILLHIVKMALLSVYHIECHWQDLLTLFVSFYYNFLPIYGLFVEILEYMLIICLKF